jgi:FAD synthetase
MAQEEELSKRVERYIKNMERLLQKISINDEKMRKIYDMAKLYTEDAKYFMNKGEIHNALIAIVYAEGLIDSILIMNDMEPESKIFPKVFVAGTFDLLHPGHIEFLKEAAKLGRVYVVVARDKNVERMKGKKPINDEVQRYEVVKSIRYVHEAFLGDPDDILKSVEKVKPDIIFLGPDQQVDEKKISEELKKRGLEPKIIRMKNRVEKWNHSSTSSIIEEIIKRYCRSTEKLQ